jgi:hypothetical protein
MVFHYHFRYLIRLFLLNPSHGQRLKQLADFPDDWLLDLDQ